MYAWKKIKRAVVLGSAMALSAGIGGGAIAVTATPAHAYTQGSTYKWDGHYWGDCNSRVTVASRSTYTTYGGTVTLQVFRCSQGFYFARGSSTKRTSYNVSLTRGNPYRYELQGGNSIYAVMTNGVQRFGGASYSAYCSCAGGSLKINFTG